MQKILAIAIISIRSAIRSRVVLSMLLLLLLVIVTLPLTIKGDGTLEGHVRVMLSYTLGLVQILLSILVIWTGCAAISMEIEDKQIQMTMTKPVRATQCWLGKWLGINALTFILLLFSGIVIYSLLLRTTTSVRYRKDRPRLRREILVARESLEPHFPGLEEKFRKAVEHKKAELKRELEKANKTNTTHGISQTEILEMQRRHIKTQLLTVGAKTNNTFRFPLPNDYDPDQKLHLEYKFSSSHIYVGELPLSWRIYAEGQPDNVFTNALRVSQRSRHMLQIPAGIGQPGQMLNVECANHHSVATLFFDTEDGFELLAYVGTFEMNYLRSLLVIYLYLCFLSAIGVSMGALYSMPVAAFASMFILTLTLLDRFIQKSAGEMTLREALGEQFNAWERFYTLFFKALYFFIEPILGPNPLDLLSTGRLVSWMLIGSVLLYRILLYCGILLWLSSWILRRRELALPM